MAPVDAQRSTDVPRDRPWCAGAGLRPAFPSGRRGRRPCSLRGRKPLSFGAAAEVRSPLPCGHGGTPLPRHHRAEPRRRWRRRPGDDRHGRERLHRGGGGSADPTALSRLVGEATLRAVETIDTGAAYDLTAVGTTDLGPARVRSRPGERGGQERLSRRLGARSQRRCRHGDGEGHPRRAQPPDSSPPSSSPEPSSPREAHSRSSRSLFECWVPWPPDLIYYHSDLMM